MAGLILLGAGSAAVFPVLLGIVGEMGIHQFVFLERVEGYGVEIMKGYNFDARDTMWLKGRSSLRRPFRALSSTAAVPRARALGSPVVPLQGSVL